MKDERLMKILRAPHISEKSTTNIERLGQYVFEVAKDATKDEIKRAVEKLFNVKVEAVRVLNVKPKIKVNRIGRGVRSGWKKAYVSLKAGEKIELMGAQA